MNKLRQLPIGTQVLLTFGILCAILLAIGGLFFFSLRSIENRIQLQHTRALNELALVDDMAQDVGQIQANILRQVLATDAGEINRLEQTIHEMEKTNARELADYQRFVYPGEERHIYDRLLQARKAYQDRTQSVLLFDRANKDAEAVALINSTQGSAYDEYLKALNSLIDHVEAGARAAAVDMTRFISRIRIIGNSLAGIAMIVAIGTGLAVTGIGRPLKEDNRLLQTEVTERKQAEETLRESEEKFRQLAANITDAFWITSPDLKAIHYVSPAYELIWGRSVESLYANPHQWVECILPEERERVFAIFGGLTQNEPSVSVEYRIARPDGAVRWVHDRGFQVRDAAGKLIRLTGIVTDITERKRAEEALQESEGKFRQLAENITDVFWITSPDLQKIHYVSPAYEQIWGRSAQSSYTNPHEWSEAILPEERERVFTTFLKLAQEPSVSVEFRIARPDGTVRWIFSRGFQVRNAAGTVIRLAGVAADITERKQLEAQLFQSQKMETVGKLAGGIAHEFNSILTAIIGRSELLLSDLPSDSPSFANAMAIRKAADLAAALTQQLLAYGRKQILRSETLDLNQILSSMESMVRHLMGSEVDVRIVTTAGLPVVKADAGQLEQVIMNIAVNAREAMQDGGKLTLETSTVTLGEEYVRRFPELKTGEYVMLAISDTGAGMNEEVKAHLFEPFFTTKGVGEGTGLGLATCHGIIKQSGGHINVYSELGRGTTFKIYLPPAEKRTEVSAIKPAAPDLPRGTETILLVEDDASLREMATLLLQRLGYAVVAAANGPEALNLTRQRDMGRIDLLFTDIVMPQMDGKELSDRIRALHPLTKTLFTSAYTENAAIHHGVLNEGVALLQKPFTPSALALKLRVVLDGRS